MACSRYLGPALAALTFACGGDGGTRETMTGATMTSITSATTPGSGDPSSGGSTADGSATQGIDTTGPGPATTPTTTGPGDPTVDPSDGPTSEPGTGPTPSDFGGGTTMFDPPPAGDYAAIFIVGDLNRISVRKADVMADWCATITFVSTPDMGPIEYDVTGQPADWKVQGALIHKGAADCLKFEGFPEEPVMAVSGSGTASWAGDCPAALGLDVTIVYPPDPNFPPEVLMQTQDLAVGSC